MELYFIRHTSVNVPVGTCYGATDVEVKDTFETEATITKGKLKGITFDHVYTSPLTRARMLAGFCGFSDAESDERIKEFDFGEWEMLSYDHLYKNDPRFAIWCDNYYTMNAPGGESLAEQEQRVRAFIRDAKSKGHKRIAAFCHGGVLALAMNILNGDKLEIQYDKIPPYGSVIKLTCDDTTVV